MCEISQEVKDEIRKFRFAKNTESSCLILKVDRKSQRIVMDEYLENISIEELQEQLIPHQPRYIVYSYKMMHEDGRISYPMCFIFFTPRDSMIELQMLYAGSKLTLQKETDLTRAYEIRDLDDLTEEWIKMKLKN
ncbi:unnamed protein product [Diamesa hyperborea]